jgi:oxalate decarboxylase/phosphoglucose isomerase-like protein (cupin superfamily)
MSHERDLVINEEDIPSLRVQREGSSAFGFARTLFDPETAGTDNAVLGVFVVPPGQSEPMVPHGHREYDESEYVVSGTGFLLMGPSRDEVKRYDLRPGSAFFVPAGYPHCVGNTGDDDMKIVFSFYPAGVKGRTYREIGSDLTDIKKVG